MKYTLFSFSLLLVMIYGCSNELDIIAPQEEVMVVYCLLNSNDSIQYVKVNKGFASEDDAPIVLAQDPDQLFFDSLNVTLVDRSNNIVHPCSKVMMEKNSGTFTSAINYVYATSDKIIPGRRYDLIVENPLTGKTVTSTLMMIGNPTAKSPNQQNINSFPIEPDKQLTVNYDADILSNIYEIRLNFVYEEINSITNVVTLDTIPWVIGTGKFNDQKRILLRLSGQLFYDHLASKLEQKGPEITRRGKSLELEYWSGDKELSTYIDVYGTSSIGVVQKKADYTNINGGHGIFAGRNQFKITGTELDIRTKTQLKTIPVLTPFRFVD